MLNWRGVAFCKTGTFGIGPKMVVSDHSFTGLHCLVNVDNLDRNQKSYFICTLLSRRGNTPLIERGRCSHASRIILTRRRRRCWGRARRETRLSNHERCIHAVAERRL